MRMVGLVAMGLAALAWASPAAAGESGVIAGTARVVDGDSLMVAAAAIRLFGIDAFEWDQTCTEASGRSWACGEAAKARLEALAEGRSVICRPRDRDRRYRRVVAVCHAGEVDLGRQLVRDGLALAYRRYSREYVAVEDAARAARAGAWAGTFTAPWLYRRRR